MRISHYVITTACRYMYAFDVSYYSCCSVACVPVSMHSGEPSPAWLCTLTLQTISAEKAAALLSYTGQGVSPFHYITDDYSHTKYALQM